MSRASNRAVGTDYQPTAAANDAVPNPELQQAMNVQSKRLPSHEKQPEHQGLETPLRNRGSIACHGSHLNENVSNVDNPATPSRPRSKGDTPAAAKDAAKTNAGSMISAPNRELSGIVNTLITEGRCLRSASTAMRSSTKIYGEKTNSTTKETTSSKDNGTTSHKSATPPSSEGSSELRTPSTLNETECSCAAGVSSEDRTSDPKPLHKGANSAQDLRGLSADNNGELASLNAHTFEENHSKSSCTLCTAMPRNMHGELGLSGLCPKHSPVTGREDFAKVHNLPGGDPNIEAPWIIFKPDPQPHAKPIEKTALLATSGDWRETRVMTVHVSKLRRRSASDEQKADADTTRLFVKPTMRFLPLPPGTGAPVVARRSQGDAKAKAGGARGLSPTGVTPHGPVVTSQPAQARRGTDATNANAGVAKGTSPEGMAPQGPAVLSPVAAGRPTTGVKKASTGAAIGTSPVGVTPKSPTATSKRPSMLPPPEPSVPPAELPKVQPSSARVSQSAAPLAGVPGPAFEPGANAPGGATPLAGAGSLTPYSPVLESEMFEGSESVNEPEYELSDTTILDVNPCLLLPLSGCNFLLIVVSVLVFLGALYAYFEEESTPAATSPNTWLVYLFLHLEAVLMVASLAVFLVASVGFLGALRENIDLLNLYTTLQGSFVTAEMIFVFMVFFLPVIGREFVISHITTELIVHYRDNQDYQNEIDYVQSSLRCCGMTENAYLDWNANQYFNCSPTNPSAERCSVPPSCCRQKEVPDIADYDTSTTAPKEAFEDTKIEEHESGASAEDDVYVTTLCGRGVMKLKERDAWKRIYTRGCGAAMFHYVESRVIEIALYTCLVILGHLILTALAVNVRNEITALVKVYDKYYKVVYRGQKRMKLNLLDEEAASPQASAQGPPLVASKEARRQRHRRRYLDARPPYKELPKDVAAAAPANNI